MEESDVMPIKVREGKGKGKEHTAATATCGGGYVSDDESAARFKSSSAALALTSRPLTHILYSLALSAWTRRTLI